MFRQRLNFRAESYEKERVLNDPCRCDSEILLRKDASLMYPFQSYHEVKINILQFTQQSEQCVSVVRVTARGITPSVLASHPHTIHCHMSTLCLKKLA